MKKKKKLKKSKKKLKLVYVPGEVEFVNVTDDDERSVYSGPQNDFLAMGTGGGFGEIASDTPRFNGINNQIFDTQSQGTLKSFNPKDDDSDTLSIPSVQAPSSYIAS